MRPLSLLRLQQRTYLLALSSHWVGPFLCPKSPQCHVSLGLYSVLPSPASSLLPPSPTFKDLCDYTGPPR